MIKKLPVIFSLLIIASTGYTQPFNNAMAFYKAGIELKNKNLYADALSSFQRAVALDKKFDSAYVEIGDMLVKTGNPGLAIANYKKALSINPSMTPALISLGNFYRDTKSDIDSALIYYHQALKTDSANKVIYYSLAWCYNAKTEYEKAITYGIKALEIDNNYRAAYNELGHAYRRTKKFAEAIEQFKKNIAISVVDLPILYSGLCYTELHDKEGALQQYEELKKVNEKMAASLKRRIDAMQ